MNIFRSYSQSPANKNTVMPHRPRNKLSPGTKAERITEEWGKFSVQERKESFLCEGETKFDICQSKYNISNRIWSCLLSIVSQHVQGFTLPCPPSEHVFSAWGGRRVYSRLRCTHALHPHTVTLPISSPKGVNSDISLPHSSLECQVWTPLAQNDVQTHLGLV